jgi:hypothetical protein
MESIVSSLNQVSSEYDGLVKILWQAPDDNYQTITSYEIEFYDSTLTTAYPDLVNCDGSMTQLFCLVDFNVFTSSPYNLAYD